MQLNTVIFKYDDQSVILPPGKMTFFETCYVDFKRIEHADFVQFQLFVHPKQPIELKAIDCQFHFSFQQGDQVYCNGFQSLSESRWYTSNTPQTHRSTLQHRGGTIKDDFYQHALAKGKNHYYSWTYSEVKSVNGKQFFIGSLNEKTAFTLIDHDVKSGQITIKKNCKGLQLSHSFPLFDFIISKDNSSAAFEHYFRLQDIKTSTYQHRTTWMAERSSKVISEQYIQQHLELFEEQISGIDIVMLGDGYQQNTGDWSNYSSGFPNGLFTILRAIKNAGFKSGIWLAPFVCTKQSNIFQKNQHWLVNNEKGKSVVVGTDPISGDNYYALDFYDRQFQDYLAAKIHYMVADLGANIIYCDLLFAACAVSRPNKTRAQVMNDALTFLHQLTKNCELMAGGVPLGSSFGLVDICQTSPSIRDIQKNKFLQLLGFGKRPELHPLRTAIERSPLRGAAFENFCGQVSLIEDKDTETADKQYTQLIISALCGGLIINSDDMRQYSPEQLGEFETVQQLSASKILKKQMPIAGVYAFELANEQGKQIAYCNLNPSQINLNNVTLEAYQSLILSK